MRQDRPQRDGREQVREPVDVVVGAFGVVALRGRLGDLYACEGRSGSRPRCPGKPFASAPISTAAQGTSVTWVEPGGISAGCSVANATRSLPERGSANVVPVSSVYPASSAAVNVAEQTAAVAGLGGIPRTFVP